MNILRLRTEVGHGPWVQPGRGGEHCPARLCFSSSLANLLGAKHLVLPGPKVLLVQKEGRGSLRPEGGALVGPGFCPY